MTKVDSDLVHNSEILYRSVSVPIAYTNGVLKISATAFNDRCYEPSVDRAKLCDNNPQKTKKSPTDGVISLVTREVRIENPSLSGTDYTLDVIAAPSKNMAHAIIKGTPKYKAKNHFRKVKERLAILAQKNGWIIRPNE